MDESDPLATQDSKGTASHNEEFLPKLTYGAVYFNQAAIMAIFFTNVPVLLRQALGMDWLALTATFLGGMTPLFLRPLLGWFVSTRSKGLNTVLLAGFALLVIGGVLTVIEIAAASSIVGGVVTGLSLSVAGATAVNVCADTHIVQHVSPADSARVNSWRRIASILGIAAGQAGFFLIVGRRASTLAAWWPFLIVPPVVAGGTIIALWTHNRSWNFLPADRPLFSAKNPLPEGNPPEVIPVPHTTRAGLVVAFVFVFLFNFPSGLVETPWENFIFEAYGADAYANYVLFGLAFIPLSLAGAYLAGRPHKNNPERSFIWVALFTAGFWLLMVGIPPFPIILVLMLGTSLLAGFIEVRIFEVMLRRAPTKKAPLWFQAFFTTLLGAKFVGVSLVPAVIETLGYAGLFVMTGWTILAWIVAAALLSHFPATHSNLVPARARLS